MSKNSLFSGHFDGRQRPTPEGLRVGDRRVDWDGGALAWSDAADVVFARREDRLCVAVGHPAFPPQIAGGNAAERWLTLYAQRGEAGLAQVGGGWSVVILAPCEGRLLLAIDRFAIQTACYAREGSRIAFAERADDVAVRDRGLDPQAIFNYLHFHMIPAPRTIFRQVRRLPQAAALQLQDGASQVRPYWRPHFEEHKRLDFATAKTKFRLLVENAVRREIGHERVGAFLSGGTDSSTVAGMLCLATGASCDTYSIGFDSEGYDEMEYARIASKHFRTRHHEYYITPEDLVSGIPAVARFHDQPFGNSSAVPAYYCAKVAKADGMEHLLAGDGGDELFGGNSRYATQRLFDAYRHVPGLIRRHLLEPVLADTDWPRKIPGLRQAGGYMRHSRIPLPDRMESFNLLDRLGPDHVLTTDFLATINLQSPMEERRETWRQCETGALVNRMLAYDWKFTLADSDLPKVRGATRMAGIGVGFPLLDTELTDFSLTLEPEWKLRKLKLRWFFKEALRGFLPDAILTKKKHGFGLPFGPWTVKHPGLRRLAQESLDSLAARGIVRQDFVSRLFANLLPEHPGYYGEMVWILMMLEQWLAAQDARTPA